MSEPAAADRPSVAVPATAPAPDLDRFRVMVELAPIALLLVDADGRIEFVNSHAERLFGYERAELVGEPVDRLVPERMRAHHPDLRAGYTRDPRPRPMGAGRDLHALRRDGTEVPVEIGLNPVRTATGRHVLAAVADITERRRAARELARKSEEVEAFVYIVSHDLRTPLVNVQGFSRELGLSCAELRRILDRAGLSADDRAEAARILDQDIADALRYISASTRRFERLLSSLLELSRLGRAAHRAETTDVQALVTATIDSMRSNIDASGARVSLAALPPAWVDPTSAGQVFANLLQNALRYLDPARAGRIEIGGRASGATCEYWVRDNGVGIPAGARDRLFQVFQRFHPELAPGEGMGLAIVKRVVERHGGRAWADSVEGEGSVFHVTFPARAPREEVL